MCSLREHGWIRNLPEHNFVCNKTGNLFEDSFKFVLPGYNLRSNEIFSAIGLEQLKKFPSFVSKRRENASYFFKKMKESGLSSTITTQLEIGESSWFGFSLIFPTKSIRSKIIDVFGFEKIDCRPVVAGNIARHPIINYFDYTVSGSLENADKVHDCGLFVGNSHEDLKMEIDFLFEVLQKEKELGLFNEFLKEGALQC